MSSATCFRMLAGTGSDSIAATRGFDPFSSAWYFDGWADQRWREGLIASPHGPPVVAAESWLLTTGWRRHGLIHITEAPPAGRPA